MASKLIITSELVLYSAVLSCSIASLCISRSVFFKNESDLGETSKFPIQVKKICPVHMNGLPDRYATIKGDELR